ncbi:hypothetical protein ASPACDRAFT_48448 [Aspergillus aculeatus ATCC 16872]|uniref:Uncharacterized protein n=1 Tax=Aspergillus aculeatus (strain ATCC 16872 / CBS 172.66 / WB 5094) TaxID=690307 RepID=A0A1L9WFQ7_ASPA1|nr:uncharacterized protein ASPACDRAFT_48448 [Aspergillus aculeatus ATCC 16872]OJJ95000.1 hypothetical protein ASPACDRAFT_48448 [Aspergillus aculeatus ATCC 16872]
MPLHTCPTDKPLDLSLWDYLTKTEGLQGSHDDPRFEIAKYQFGDAAKNFKIQHHKARMYYHEAKGEGIVEEEMSFERWSQMNMPALQIALREFQYKKDQLAKAGLMIYGPGYQERMERGAHESATKATAEDGFFS